MSGLSGSAPPVELAVRGGTVADARWHGLADLFVAGGRVQAVVAPGTPLPAGSGGATEIGASGQLVLPGGVDPHCHVGFTSGDFTSLDDYRQCTTAAVFGGTTTIVDFAIPRPGEVPADVAYAQRAKASQGLCDSALHACVVAWDDTVPGQLASLVADGIVTVKMFTTYRGENMADDDTVLRTMTALRDTGGMVVVHCEANHLIEDAQHHGAAHGRIGAADMAATRPELAETASVAEILAIAESLRSPVYFVHQSTAEATALVAGARRRGVAAFTETVAHHLVLDDSRYAGAEPERFVCCPPLRPAAAVAGLGQQLFTGEVTTIGSDHCCYDLDQKTGQPPRRPHDAQRPARRRDPPAGDLLRVRREAGPARHPVRRADGGQPGPRQRHLPAQGDTDARRRRRPGAVGPGPRVDGHRRRAAHGDRLHSIRGPGPDRLPGHGHRRRPRRRPRRHAARPGPAGPAPAGQPAAPDPHLAAASAHGRLTDLGALAAKGRHVQVVTIGPAEVRAAVPVRDAMRAVGDSFRALARGEFELPARTVLRDGGFLVMSAHHRPTPSAVVKTLSLNFGGRDPAIAGTVQWSKLCRLEGIVLIWPQAGAGASHLARSPGVSAPGSVRSRGRSLRCRPRSPSPP